MKVLTWLLALAVVFTCTSAEEETTTSSAESTSEEASSKEDEASSKESKKKKKSAPFLLDLKCSACAKTASQVHSSLQAYNATTDVDATGDVDGTLMATTLLSGICARFVGISIGGYEPNRVFKDLLGDVLNGGSLNIDALSGNAKDEAQLKALCAEFVSGVKAAPKAEADADADADAAADVDADASAAVTPGAKLVKLVAKEVVRIRENDTEYDTKVLKRSQLKTKLCPSILKKCAKLQKQQQKKWDDYKYDDYSSYKPKKPTTIPVVLTKSERCLMKAMGALEAQHWKKAGSKAACAMKVHTPAAKEGSDADADAEDDEDSSSAAKKKRKAARKKKKKEEEKKEKKKAKKKKKKSKKKKTDSDE